jgi:ABC-type sulfate transport system permease subunit
MKDLGYQNLGFINLAIIYLTFSLTSTIAVPINKFFGTSLTLCLSAFTYALWIASFLFPAIKS